MNQQKMESISFLRVISTFMIIICHFLQFYGNELAYWFNVGVQIFLLISGFLFGQKVIDKIGKFYKKRLLRILVDYYLYIIVVIPLYWIFHKEAISLYTTLKQILCLSCLPGLNHLWFIRTIILCYLITPFLQKIFKNGKKEVFLGIEVFVFFIFITGRFFTSAWINCYIMGYFFGKQYKERGNGVIKDFSRIAIPVAVIMNGSQIVVDYILKLEFTGGWSYAFQVWTEYSHVFLAIAFFGIVMQLYKDKQNMIYKDFLNFFDRHSYDIYIVHHIYILGPFSLLSQDKFGGGGNCACSSNNSINSPNTYE